MSAFLGPIHFWLYSKIEVQHQITEKIVLLSEEKQLNLELKRKLDEQFGKIEIKPLEEIIDAQNIHGWLQERISEVEYRLAFAVTNLLKNYPDLKEELLQIFEKKGEAVYIQKKPSNPSQVYKMISDTLLDGMPCDHANDVVLEDDDKVVWKRNECVHKKYWDVVEGDITHYYQCRDAFIQGILKDTDLVYEKIDEITNEIKKGDHNESYK